MIIRSASIPSELKQHCEDFVHVRYDMLTNTLIGAVGDWANNLVGGKYILAEINEQRSIPPDTLLGGGAIGASVAENVISFSTATGKDLIERINDAIAHRYNELQESGRMEKVDVAKSRPYSFTGYIAHFVATPTELTVTAVGDVRLAADGRVIAGMTKAIDVYNACVRSEFIEGATSEDDLHARTEQGFAYVRPRIIAQYEHQNTPGHRFSYPAIDGTKTLHDGITNFTVPLPKKILLYSDGYVEPANFGEAFSIEGLENHLRHIYTVDPFRYKEFPAVGYPRDDRTALEVDFDGWDEVQFRTVALPQWARENPALK